MKTLEKNIDIKKMKAHIKDLAEIQKFYKNQRKTTNLVGERIMDASTASIKFIVNRLYLRLLYGAYGLVRGKRFSQTENHYPEENHPLHEFDFEIDKIIEKFEYKSKK